MMNKKCCNDKTYTEITSPQQEQQLSVSQGTNQSPKVNIQSFFSFHRPFSSIPNRLVELSSCSDLFPIIFYMMNLETLLTCRLVSPQWLKFVHTNISDSLQFTPLFNKARISFKYKEICDSKIDDIERKYDFAKNNTGIIISCTLARLLEKEPNLSTKLEDLSKNQPYISLHINTSEELTLLNTLLASSQFNTEQKSILNKTKSLVLFNYYNPTHGGTETIYNRNIGSINQLLATLAQSNIFFPQLTTLRLGYINDSMTLCALPDLISLEIDYINAPLTLPFLPNLKSLKVGSINASLTLNDLPQLVSFELGDICVPVNLPSLPNLLSLKFRNIYAAVTLPTNFPKLVSLRFGNFNTLLELPPLHNLTWLEFGSIGMDGVVTLPSFPNLASLSFRTINGDMTIPFLRNLYSLKFGNIRLGTVKLPSLPNLSSLEFGKIEGEVILADIHQLLLFSFRQYTLYQSLKIILNFIINCLNILLRTKIGLIY